MHYHSKEPEIFRKDDAEKLMFSLIEPAFLEGMAKVLTDGGIRYGFNNWKNLRSEEKTRYKDALLRHINNYMKGHMLDDDSHQHEMLHVACNAMFLHYFDTIDREVK